MMIEEEEKRKKSPIRVSPILLAGWPVGRVKNVSKRVFKNPLAFFADILCKLMGHLAKKDVQRIFNGGKLTSKPPIQK